MKNIFKYFVIILISFAGCSPKNDLKQGGIYNGEKIKSLVEKAIAADTTANDSLSGLINLFYPVDKNYNAFTVDSIITESGQTLYTVLLEYPNPVYNRFAVYDAYLTPYILDNSLNGNLNLSMVKLNGDKYISLTESFYSKNSYKLTRLSLYKMFPKSIKLVYRAFSTLKVPGNEFYQQVVELSPDRVKTLINSKKLSDMSNKGDIFLWNTDKNKYISHDSIFYKLVLKEIGSSKGTSNKNEIASEDDALKSVGISTKHTSQNDFTLKISNDWKELDNLKITLNSNHEMNGTRFINANLGASISVVKLKPGDNSEKIINNSLIHREGGKFNLRSSREIISGKNVIQFWEFSCQSKKYLLILEASKYTFDKYRSMYGEIIRSFDTGC